MNSVEWWQEMRESLEKEAQKMLQSQEPSPRTNRRRTRSWLEAVSLLFTFVVYKSFLFICTHRLCVQKENIEQVLRSNSTPTLIGSPEKQRPTGTAVSSTSSTEEQPPQQLTVSAPPSTGATPEETKKTEPVAAATTGAADWWGGK